jgi:hypothetical protein
MSAVVPTAHPDVAVAPNSTAMHVTATMFVPFAPTVTSGTGHVAFQVAAHHHAPHHAHRRIGDGRKLKEFSASRLDASVLDVPISLSFQCDCDRIPNKWTITPLAGGNEYHVVNAGGFFLGAPEKGSRVTLAPGDDGSGRQRWVFKHAGQHGDAAEFTLRVAGGKKDDNVYLGVDGSTMRLYPSSAAAKRFVITSLADDSNAPPAAATNPKAPAAQAASRIPDAAVPALERLTKLTVGQMDAILQLISLPENSTPKWYANYGYVEFLGDGRGFTATIFGACSGTGDLAMIVEELAKIEDTSAPARKLVAMLPALRKKRGDDIKGIEGVKPLISSLGDDPAWQQAVWAVYVKLYWKFAMEFADKRGAGASRPGPVLRTAAARGFMLDTAVNHGADAASVMQVVDRMSRASRESSDEVEWVQGFAKARHAMLKSGYGNLDTSRTGDRATMWQRLVRENPGLDTPFRAYDGYWGSFTIR